MNGSLIAKCQVSRFLPVVLTIGRKLKYLLILPLLVIQLMLSSCTTDAYGNTTVTPGGAVAIGVGALALGALIGAAVADDDHDYHHCNDDNYCYESSSFCSYEDYGY
ncbi:MAG: hypothetical protein RR250_06560 [Akkermansia sp.]